MKEPHWLAGVEGAHFLSSLFPDRPPLARCQIHTVSFEGNGGWIRIRFDVDQPPQTVPKKWAQQKFNTAQVEMTVFDPSALQLDGWGSVPAARIDWRATEQEWSVTVEHQHGRVVCNATAIRIDGVSGYLDVPSTSA